MSPGALLFPENVSCRQCSRGDVKEFAEAARELGVQYVGLCCGATPALVREVAQVFGRTPTLARFAPDTSRCFYFREEGGVMRDFLFGLRDTWP